MPQLQIDIQREILVVRKQFAVSTGQHVEPARLPEVQVEDVEEEGRVRVVHVRGFDPDGLADVQDSGPDVA